MRRNIALRILLVLKAAAAVVPWLHIKQRNVPGIGRFLGLLFLCQGRRRRCVVCPAMRVKYTHGRERERGNMALFFSVCVLQGETPWADTQQHHHKDEAPCWDRTRQTFHNTKSSFSFLHFSYPNRDSDWQEINSPVCIYLTNHKINIKKKKKNFRFLGKEEKVTGRAYFNRWMTPYLLDRVNPAEIHLPPLLFIFLLQNLFCAGWRHRMKIPHE